MRSTLVRDSGPLQRLEKVASRSVPILSVYLNLLPRSDEASSIGARLRDHLKPIKGLADSGTLDHAAATSLHRGIARVLESGPTLEAHLGNGWAMFVCDQLDLEEHLIVPSKVWDCAMAGSRPYLRPLRAAIGKSKRVATVVLDARRADITVSRLGEILDRKTIKAEVVRDANRGGWHGLDEHRNRQHADEVRKQLWRETAETLSELHQEAGIDVIFLGGQDRATAGLAGSLGPAIRPLLGESFNVDVHSLTEPQLMQIVGSLHETYERKEESRVVADMYAASAADDSAAIGLERVIGAVNQQAVSFLATQHGAVVVGQSCPGCGSISSSERTCRACGTVTTALADVLDEISHAVISSGGVVMDVMSETKLVDDIVAGTLRFSIR